MTQCAWKRERERERERETERENKNNKSNGRTTTFDQYIMKVVIYTTMSVDMRGSPIPP